MSRRALVVDDEADLRLLTSLTLEDAGWEVSTADGGKDGLAMLEAEWFDLVLLDTMMPDMDGAEMCRRLRADRRFDAVPVIFLSAAVRQTGSEKLMESGAAGAIGKPFDVDTLGEEIEAILRAVEHPSRRDEVLVPAPAASPGRVQEAWEAVRTAVAESSGRITDLVNRLETDLEELRRFSHSLAGKAPMVGLTIVGAEAERLESEISGGRWIAVRAAAQALVRAIGEAGHDPRPAPEIFVAGDERPRALERQGTLVAVDDDEDLLLLIQGAFEQVGWEVRTATNEASLLALLDERLPDGITLDIDMPEMNGLELCARLREKPELREVPVLFLTSRSRPEDVARGLSLGSDDYLVKSLPLPELVTRVVSRVQRAHLLLREARSDTLTGLSNRRAIEETVATLAIEHWRTRQCLSLAIIDLDHFKRVNDTFGHTTGDVVLKRVAAHLGAGIRRSDRCGRWGGEEFLLVLPFTTEANAVQMIDRQCSELAATRIDSGLESPLTDTFLARVAAGVPKDLSASALIQAADAACYEAKRRGRNQVVAASASVTNVTR